MKLKKFIEFITEDFSQSEKNVTEEKSSVIRKFIKYVNMLPEFASTSKIRLNSELGGMDDYKDDIHTFILYSTWKEPVYDESTGKNIRLDDSIDYFIFGFYHDEIVTERSFYVYEDGKFRESTDSEDDFFRALDDEIMLLNQDNLLSIDYDDWKKGRERSEESMLKINEE